MNNSKTDLSSELTAFVISVGENPNYELCIKALQNQTVKFNIEIIKDYTPLPLAFQEMLNRCKTKYYIEVDEDMVLDEDAVEKMYQKIIKTDTKTAMAAFQLYDPHADYVIFGIKIYKHNILENYPYNLNHPSCEVEQINNFEKDGFTVKMYNFPVGKHSPLWTEELVFERYYNLMRKFSIYHYVWLENMPLKLLNKVQKEPSRINILALLGAYQGVISSNLTEEKDFSKKIKEFKMIDSFLNEPVQSTLYMTSKCNYKCNFCYRQYHEIQSAKDMNLEILSDFFYKFPSIKSTCLCGYGETLMCDNLISILKWLKYNNKFTGLITNGYFLEDRYRAMNPYLPDYISVSINAANKRDYEKITGIDGWDKMIRGLKIVKDCTLCTSFVVTQQNWKSIEELLPILIDSGVKKLHLHNVLPHFKEKDESFWDTVLLKEQSHILEEIKNFKGSEIIERYPVLIDKSGGKQNCLFPWRSLAVNGDGNISFCNSVFPCDSKYGNIQDYTVWNGEIANNFRKKYLNNEIPQCKKCFRNWKWQ